MNPARYFVSRRLRACPLFSSKRWIIVTDTLSDPLTVAFRALAIEHDLRAGWSTPILASDGRLLGTFALYYHVVTPPTMEHLQIVEDATALAQIAIERQNTETALR